MRERTPFLVGTTNAKNRFSPVEVVMGEMRGRTQARGGGDGSFRKTLSGVQAGVVHTERM